MDIFLTVLKYVGLTIGAILALEILFFLFVFTSSLFLNTKEISNKNSKFCRFLLNASAGLVFFMDRVHIHTTGLEKIPRDQKCLIVCNHRSNFDPITGWFAFRKFDVSYITKPENLKIPFYGKIIQKCCFMPIDRHSAKGALPTIDRAAELLKNNVVSVGVYPEGTRSKKLVLLPFHAAVFKIAIKAEVPVVVASTFGTERIAKAFPFGRSDVYIDVLDVIPAEVVKESKSVDLSNKAEELIRANLTKYEN